LADSRVQGCGNREDGGFSPADWTYVILHSGFAKLQLALRGQVCV
jgi:hypothetical protein